MTTKNMTGQQKNTLTLQMQFQLGDLIKSNYVERNEYDEQFAVWASSQLEFPVTKANVQSTRTALNIPSKREVDSTPKTLIERVESLEKRINALELSYVAHLGKQ